MATPSLSDSNFKMVKNKIVHQPQNDLERVYFLLPQDPFFNVEGDYPFDDEIGWNGIDFLDSFNNYIEVGYTDEAAPNRKVSA